MRYRIKFVPNAHSTIVFVPGLGDTSLDDAHTLLAEEYALSGYHTVQYQPAPLQSHPQGGFWNNTLTVELDAAAKMLAAVKLEERLKDRIVLHAHSALASVVHALYANAYIAAMPIELSAVGQLRREAIAKALGHSLTGLYDPAIEKVSIGIGKTKWGYTVPFFLDYDEWAYKITQMDSSAPTLRCFGSQDPLPLQVRSISRKTTDTYLPLAHHFRKRHQATALAHAGIAWDSLNIR